MRVVLNINENESLDDFLSRAKNEKGKLFCQKKTNGTKEVQMVKLFGASTGDKTKLDTIILTIVDKKMGINNITYNKNMNSIKKNLY